MIHLIPTRQHWIGASLAVALVAVGSAAWWGWSTYQQTKMTHARAEEAFKVLAMYVDPKVTFVDADGKRRPFTVGEVLVMIAQERVELAKRQQQATAQPSGESK